MQAILEGYEEKINHKYWLAEAFQKEAIQNSWDARVNKKRGKNWWFKFFYFSKYSILGFVDGGMWGLTGIIPKNKGDVVRALKNKEKGKENLAHFLSSNWSSKPREAIGSRGRGKMIFLGASREKSIYFDSIRSGDKQYVFGKIFLDSDKDIKVEINSGRTADEQRRKIFKEIIPPLSSSGTRIILSNPRSEVVEALTKGEMIHLIQHTWWEILAKYQVKIGIEINGKNKPIPSSPFLPVKNLRINETDSPGPIELKGGSGLRIKEISLCYLGDKDVSKYYKGLAIQVHGMMVERLKIEDLVMEPIGRKIYGTITFDKELDNKMADCEGPEHCNIIWTRFPANKVRKKLKIEIRKFAEKYRLIEKQKAHVSKEQRAVEIKVQKDLNKLAKILGLRGTGGKRRERIGGERSAIEKLRLSIADFETPYENGRVDRGQCVEGTYVVPVNEYSASLLVLVKVWIFRKKDGKVIKSTEEELRIPQEEKKIGWPKIRIDNSFERGGYTFRAEMRSLEDVKINENISYEKGELIYHQVSRTFYVEEDPPLEKGKGFFKPEDRPTQDKRRYIWIEEGDNQYILCYNSNHPIIHSIESVSKGEEWKESLRRLLLREGSYFAFAIRLIEDKALIEEGKKPLFFKKDEIKEDDFQALLTCLGLYRSSYLWDFYKSEK